MGGFTANPTTRLGQPATREPTGLAIDAVDALAREAAAWVAREIARTVASASGGMQAARRYQTEGDLVYLIQLLLGALATTQTAYFTSYIQWLRTTLTTRGVAAETIAQSLNFLLAFYEGRLPTAQAEEVGHILRAGLAALGGGAAQAGEAGDAGARAAAEDAWPEVAVLTQRLMVGDLPGARAILIDVAERRRDYVEIAVRLLQPALYAVGDCWQSNRMTVADANLAGEICRLLLVELMTWTVPRVGDSDRSIILATIENDRHVMGVQIVADAFVIAGWKTVCLGSTVNTSSLVQIVDRQRPDAVGLSVSLLQQLPMLKVAVNRLKSELGNHCPCIIVGGRPTNEIDGLWRWSGADAWSASAETAVAQLTSCVRRQ